jgi:hypothetical protein
MKQISMSMILVLFFMSIGMAQDEAAVEPTAEQPEVADSAASVDVPQTSPLDELGWMTGKWVDEGQDSKITTTCSWKMNRKFLTRSFRVTLDNQVTLTGNQVIGWDPLAGQIRSWTFDSEGGIGEGLWIRDGNRWLVKTSFVLASGDRASAINVITYVDQDTLRWRSTNREIAGELQPNIPEVTVVRQKPAEPESPQGEQEVSP